MPVGGLVASNILCGDDEIELDWKMFRGRGEQVGIDIGKNPELVLFLQVLECVVGIWKRRPGRKQVGECFGATGGERNREAFGEADGDFFKNLAVGAIVFRLYPSLDVNVYLKQLLGLCSGVMVEQLAQAVSQTSVPVDQSSVAVKRNGRHAR